MITKEQTHTCPHCRQDFDVSFRINQPPRKLAQCPHCKAICSVTAAVGHAPVVQPDPRLKAPGRGREKRPL